MKREYLTYGEYGRMLDELTEQIDGTKFDAILGIPRGGLPTAVHLSHRLQIELISGTDELKKFAENNGKVSVLIVDDVVDTGKTIDELSGCLNGIEWRSAALYYKPRASFRPDYYVRETDAWIVFPWERPDEPPNR